MSTEAAGHADTSTRETETLCEVMQPLLRLLARQYARSWHDADDIVQQGVIRFLRYGQSKADDPRAYLATCVRNAAMDFLKRRQQRADHELAAAEVRTRQPPWLECPVELQEQRTAVESAVCKLPVEQREVVVLKTWAGFTFAEIGEMTGVSPNTAASRYRYALAALEHELKELRW